MRGLDLGYCWDMSGVRGFFGEGYPYHKFWQPFGLTFRGSRFTSKTTTLLKRAGNMPLGADGITPVEFVPACIAVNLVGGYALNAVSLSGPGLEFLLDTGRWQKRTTPWIFSFMSLESDPVKRRDELTEAARMLKTYLPGFVSLFVFQLNVSCPNVEGMTHAVDEVIEEAEESFAIVAEQLPELPQVPKLGLTMPPAGAHRLANNKHCDGLCCTNTVKWGDLAHLIDWSKLFDKTGVSPLARFGGGGLSGKLLFPLAIDWTKAVRGEGVTKPLVIGGGILGPRDVPPIRRAGASAIAVGSMSMLRPWNMQRTINRANQIGPYAK